MSALFATGSLAKRIERAESTLIAGGATAAARRLPSEDVILMPLAGGIAAFVESNSPFNKVAGLGFDGLPDEGQLDLLERELARRGAPVRVELASLASPDLARLFSRRGYELVGFENVLGLSLDTPGPNPWDSSGGGNGIHVARAETGEAPIWMDVVASGFLTPDTFDGPESHESYDRTALDRVFGDMVAAGGFIQYLARRHDEVAGGAGLRLFEGVAQLCGAATLPEHRRHGVQTALLRHRLDEAASAGCTMAVVTTQPGSKSQQNVQRFGFSVLYVRAILEKRAAA